MVDCDDKDNYNYDAPIEETSYEYYEVHLPNGVVIDGSTLDEAKHTVVHFRGTKYPTGRMRIVKVNTIRREQTIFTDG